MLKLYKHMETLTRINSAFENVRNVIKTKKSSERIHDIKNDIQSLGCELVLLGKENHAQFVRSLAMEAYLTLLSVRTMPLSPKEKRNTLRSAFDKLKPYALSDECLFVFLRIQNLLCYYLIQLDQIELAQSILQNMEDIYDKINKTQPITYLNTESLFSPEPIEKVKKLNPEKIDKIITNNIQMQAFLFNKQNMHEKYTLYNHTALRRQLEAKEGTPHEWAMRTARLGNYFTYLQEIGNARHHLCAAYHVLRTCHDNCKLLPEEFIKQQSEFELNFLELSHYFVKYGLILFQLSKKKIIKKCFVLPSSAEMNLWNSVHALNEIERGHIPSLEEHNTELGFERTEEDLRQEQVYTFPSLNFKEMENRIPLALVSKIEDAKLLFSFTHKWLMRAKHYYDIEHYPAQYISCCLQLAELYEHLAFFERDLDNQYNLQRRRCDVLESLHGVLKTCDDVTTVQVDVIKELSQVQLELMALNLQKLWLKESQTNIFEVNTDSESIMNSLNSTESMKTLTEKTLNVSSKNLFLRKMEAATCLNGKLLRLGEQLNIAAPSILSIKSSSLFKN